MTTKISPDNRTLYYRPVWTSGRYDPLTHSAIFYNLLTGMSFFFEDESADIIGNILSAGRNGEINIEKLNIKNVSVNDIEDFISELLNVGLIIRKPLSESEITEKRELTAMSKTASQGRLIMSTEEQELADAEKDYLIRSKSHIFSLLIELTYSCSEKCIHCYNPGATRNDNEQNYRHIKNELDFDEYVRIIDEFYDLGLIRVTLSGGDPFSKPIVWDIMKYLYEKDIVFDVYTNGQRLLGQETILANLFPCSVGFSIYSDIPEIHDSITRIPGSLNKTLTVLDRIFNSSIPIQIKCCLMHQNCKSYRGVAKIADKYSAAFQVDCNIFDSVDGDSCASKYLRLSPEEMRLVLRDNDLLTYVGPELEDFGSRNLPRDKNVCAAGFSSFCLTPDGRITLCPSFPSSIGNLRTNTVKEILQSPELKWWRNIKWSDYTDCGTKDYCSYCAPCPGLNFSANGNPLKPSENNCYIAKLRKDVADLIREGKDPLNNQKIEDALQTLPKYEEKSIKRVTTFNHYGKSLMSKG